MAVSALDEAVTIFRRALSLLAELPPSPGRDALELDIRIALGSLVALEGYGSIGAHQLYARAFLSAASSTESWIPRFSAVSARPAAGLPPRRVQRARPGRSSTMKAMIRSRRPRDGISSA